MNTSRRNTIKQAVVEPDLASAVEMRCVAVKSGASDALVGTGGLLHFSAWSQLLQLFFGPFDALVERLQRRFDVFTLFLEIANLVPRLLERQLELSAMPLKRIEVENLANV